MQGHDNKSMYETPGLEKLQRAGNTADEKLTSLGTIGT